MRKVYPEHAMDAVHGCLEACRRCEELLDAVLGQDAAAFSMHL